MMFRSTFGESDLANEIETAVQSTLADGLRTADIVSEGETAASTQEMGDAVIERMVANRMPRGPIARWSVNTTTSNRMT